MGRSIPSFRILIDIERSEWRTFGEKLSNRQDKGYLNKLFFIPELYCHSLSNLSNPIIIESILLSVIFQGFKEIDKLSSDFNICLSDRKNVDFTSQQNTKSWSKFVTSTNEKMNDKDYYFAQILE